MPIPSIVTSDGDTRSGYDLLVDCDAFYFFALGVQ